MNQNLKNKTIVWNNEEYIISEPLGMGNYYWRVRNLNDDSTEDISVEILKEKINTYKQDLFELENRGIKAVYSREGFVKVSINGKSEKIIISENLDEISELFKLISNKFNIDLVEEDITEESNEV